MLFGFGNGLKGLIREFEYERRGENLASEEAQENAEPDGSEDTGVLPAMVVTLEGENQSVPA
jgi:hypothetical protein